MKRINRQKLLLVVVLIVFVFSTMAYIQNRALDSSRKSVQEAALGK